MYLYYYYCHVFIASPPYSPVDPETAADDTVEYDDYVDDQPLAAEVPGKQSPFPLPDITYLFCIILALVIAAAAR